MPHAPLITLAISHHLFLDRDHRYALAKGDSVAACGVSVPVWFAKGKSNEPAAEVFCNYLLHNVPTNLDHVHFKPDGYEINIPQLPTGFTLPDHLSPDEWGVLEPEEATAVMEERSFPTHGGLLRDIADGGAECLFFTVDGRGRLRETMVTIRHSIHINDLGLLTKTLV